MSKLRGVLGVSVVLALSLSAVSCSDSGSGASLTADEGNAFFIAGRWEEAITAYTAVIERDPNLDTLVSAHLNRSLAFVELGRIEEAIADETRVISLASGEPTLAAALGQAYLNRSREFGNLERWTEALADSEAVIALNPQNRLDLAKAQFNRAVYLVELDRKGEALKAVEEVINLNPDHERLLSEAHSYRLWLMAEGGVGSDDDVLASASAVIDLALGNVEQLADAHFYRAATLVFLGRTAEAETDLQAVVDLLPADHHRSLSAKELLITIKG